MLSVLVWNESHLVLFPTAFRSAWSSQHNCIKTWEFPFHLGHDMPFVVGWSFAEDSPKFQMVHIDTKTIAIPVKICLKKNENLDFYLENVQMNWKLWNNNLPSCVFNALCIRSPNGPIHSWHTFASFRNVRHLTYRYDVAL